MNASDFSFLQPKEELPAAILTISRRSECPSCSTDGWLSAIETVPAPDLEGRQESVSHKANGVSARFDTGTRSKLGSNAFGPHSPKLVDFLLHCFRFLIILEIRGAACSPEQVPGQGTAGSARRNPASKNPNQNKQKSSSLKESSLNVPELREVLWGVAWELGSCNCFEFGWDVFGIPR